VLRGRDAAVGIHPVRQDHELEHEHLAAVAVLMLAHAPPVAGMVSEPPFRVVAH
jgi:hypothetical protein